MPWSPSAISLAALIAELPGAVLARGDAHTLITGVTQDSRVVEPGDLFVAVPGLQRNGLEFVPDALRRQAAAVATEAVVDTTVPVIRVQNAREALADLSAAFYGHPSKGLPVVGITGTDGKTSTTHLLSAILEAHGLRTGWLTTVNTRIGADVRPNAVDHTTPEAPVIQRTLAEMRSAGVAVAIVETSSHALALDRVRGTEFRVGVFTNLSSEHLNFHGTFEAYAAAKARLFERLPPDGLAVLNADDPNSAVMRAATRAPVRTYGLAARADVTAANVRLSPQGTRYVLQPDNVEVETRLVGRFNVSNWLAAYTAATFFGAGPQDLQAAAHQQAPVPGRMNLVRAGQPYSVIVDFAHTPQALEKAIDTIRELGVRRVMLVFGLAGGRDFANRPVMGELAARKADFFVISSDDPGDENPADIAAEIAAGAGNGAQFNIELDRRVAIAQLLDRAEPGDAVLLAGKGHEQRMVVKNQRVPWNDARVALELLAERGFAASGSGKVEAVP
ncbi:MAG: UDP-N-acetylmuramoyl-L-alanyl-D-glutamate--2,6-diaminopimelate ligase [Chloroflexi bacterium]|nr:UDP-N-acetylmuramoyl-L-alanyl-D-glutamate--2,6-diaminopimelate ligase [Chloroflexota bacterium]